MGVKTKEMNRIHLYRGKRLDNGQFIEGSLIGEDVIVGKIVDFEEDYFTTEFWYKVNPETVGQFTGMTDKNGTKIFEGDIYNMGDDNIRYVVVWRKCMFIGKQIGSNSYAGLDYFESDIKKVGNIYDNKELLK